MAASLTRDSDGSYILRAPFGLKDRLAELPGCRWDKGLAARTFGPDLVEPMRSALQAGGVGLTLKDLDGPWPPRPAVLRPEQKATLDALLVRFPLRPYQRDGIEFVLANGMGLLAFDMGLGKSISALATALVVGGPMLVVVPGIVRSVWTGTETAPGEVGKWLPEWDFRVLRGRTEIDPALLANVGRQTVVLANYEILDYQERKEGLTESGWLPFLKAIPWKVIALDEAHGVKNRKGKRTKAILALRDAAPKALRVLLTGTPLHNRPRDLWQLLDFLKPDSFGTYWRFSTHYCAGHQGDFGWTDTGLSHAEELKHRLKWFMVRKTKAEVAHLLPPKVRQVVALQPSKAAAGRLDAAFADLARRRAAEAHRLPTREEMLAIVHSEASEKFEAMQSILDGRDGRAVVFTYRRDTAKAVWATLKKAGVAAFGIHGELPEVQRAMQLDGFRHSEGGVLVATMGVGGLGIDLSAASVVLFLDLDPVPGTLLQCEDRLWRPPQQSSVTCYYLCLRGTVDEQMARLVCDKLEAYQELLGREDQAGGLQDTLEAAMAALNDEKASIAALTALLAEAA